MAFRQRTRQRARSSLNSSSLCLRITATSPSIKSRTSIDFLMFLPKRTRSMPASHAWQAALVGSRSFDMAIMSISSDIQTPPKPNPLLRSLDIVFSDKLAGLTASIDSKRRCPIITTATLQLLLAEWAVKRKEKCHRAGQNQPLVGGLKPATWVSSLYLISSSIYSSQRAFRRVFP